MKIIDITPEYEKTYFCCLEDWSDEMKEAGDNKQKWYDRMKDKGVRVKLAQGDNGEINGMIQYMPIEDSIFEGENLYAILCIWVHGHKEGVGNHQKKGIGTALLNAAEADCRELGTNGLVAWGMGIPVWMKASWFRKHGYKVVDKSGMSRLLWKPFNKQAVPPKMIKQKKKPGKGKEKINITMFRNGWCPAMNLVYERTLRASEEFKGKVNIEQYDTIDKGVLNQWGITDGLYIDGKSIRMGPPPSYDKIRKKIEKRARRKKFNQLTSLKMKIKNLALASLFGLLIILAGHTFVQAQSADPFLGLWALDLDYESSSAGWMEIRQEDGYLDASVLWRSGSVYPVEFVFTAEDHLIITHSNKVIREKDGSGEPVREHRQIFWFDLTKEGNDKVSGKRFSPNENGIGVEEVSFTGKRIPEYGSAPNLGDIQFGKKVRLLNGRDLSGWELLEPSSVSGWKVIDGVLVNDPVQTEGEPHIHYGNLRTTETFEDFNLKLEVNVPEGSNSGVYLRGIYEVQVLDSYGKPLDSHNMGALYSRIVPLMAAEKPAGEWQKMDITLYKRHLTVLLNGRMIINNQPVKGVTGGAMTADEFLPGPIYLQGDHGKVSYRNIELIPILD